MRSSDHYKLSQGAGKMNEIDLFSAALAITDPAERAAWLDAECAGDHALKQRLEKLLAAAAAAGNPLDDNPRDDPGRTLPTPDPAVGAAAPFQAPVGTAGGVVAGRYKLLQPIGEGGMGSVWMAEQIEPVKRKVAVKLIRAERGSSSTILARFEAERQAIALMDHPHIAKLLDAGTTAEGLPFFVMELVKGIPLNQFCDRHKLDVSERLVLFTQICSAVQHAHQKGIIHRDLKPTNILVESHDGKPVPRVIDFGLAKATSGMQLSEHTLFTGFGAVMGTPLYMAPEQATFNAVDVDTRADLYALGVILYELLTGTTPLTRETFKEAALDEMLRLIREQDAPSPSSRLSSTDARPAIAANRHTDATRLSRLLKGELDWIVMKALAKERDRRYETANGLARDIERFLNHEPVIAGPPGARYRLRKFVRRNRGAVVAASLVLLTLLAGIAGTTWGLIAANRARLAEKTRAEGEQLAKLEAQSQTSQAEHAAQAERVAREKETAERKYAEAIASFVTDDFLALTSVEGQLRFGGAERAGLSKDTTLRELLNRAATKLDDRHDLDPRIEAGLRWMIGENLRGAGEYARSVAFLERCVALRKAALGREHADTLSALHSLAVAYKANGEPGKAIALYAQVRDAWAVALGAHHPDTLTALANLAAAYQSAGKLSQSIALFEQVRDAEANSLGADHPSALITLNDLGLAYTAAGMLPKAVKLFEHLRAVRVKTLGPDHPDTVGTLNNLALAYRAAGRLQEAIQLFEQVRESWVKTLGSDHPDTLTALNNLALAYQDAGKLREAAALFEHVRDAHMKKLGPDHPNTLSTLNNLAMSYKDAGKPEEAIALLEQVRITRVKTQGAEHPDTLTTLDNLAAAYQDAGNVAKAIALHEQVRDSRAKILGDEHPGTLSTLNNLGAAYRAAGRLQESIALLETARNAAVTTVGAEHPITLATLSGLARAYQDTGKLQQAVTLFEQVRDALVKTLGADHPRTLTSLCNLATAYQLAGSVPEAIGLFEKVAAGIEKRQFQHQYARRLMSRAIAAFTAANQLDKAECWRRKWMAAVGQQHGATSPAYACELASLGLNLLQQHKWADAEPVLRESWVIRKKNEADDWRTFNTMSMLGGALLGQKNYTAAEPLLVNGYEGMKARASTIPLDAATPMPEALDRLIELATATTQPDDVRTWQAEKAKLTMVKNVESATANQ
jgi:tetratricopeptide (TPR) repeat protein